jgi:competence protein ComEA
MYPLYKFFYNLVGFSRNQTNGFLLFLPLLIGIILAPAILRRYISTGSNDYEADVLKLQALVSEWEQEQTIIDSTKVVKPSFSHKKVDLNTASREEFLAVGFDQRVAERILSYRRHGGKFRNTQELLKIYGLDSGFFHSVENKLYVRAGRTTRDVSEIKSELTKRGNNTRHVVHFDLNEADTSELKKVYGIGEKLALRIIKYRDVLGGYVSMNQLGEIYKLDTAVVKRIKQKFFVEENFVPSKLDINTAERQELAAHPYISDKVADAIVTYRFHHGRFEKLEDLRRIPMIDSVIFLRTEPYLDAK